MKVGRKDSERVRANILSSRTFSAARETIVQKHTKKVSDTHILFGGESKLLHVIAMICTLRYLGFKLPEVLKINFNLLSIFSEQINRSDHASSGRFNTKKLQKIKNYKTVSPKSDRGRLRGGRLQEALIIGL